MRVFITRSHGNDLNPFTHASRYAPWLRPHRSVSTTDGRHASSLVQAPLLTAGGGNRALPSFVLRRGSWPGAQATTTGVPSAAALKLGSNNKWLCAAGRFPRCWRGLTTGTVPGGGGVANSPSAAAYGAHHQDRAQPPLVTYERLDKKTAQFGTCMRSILGVANCPSHAGWLKGSSRYRSRSRIEA